MRTVFAFLIGLALSACGAFDTEQMFSAHVAAVPPANVHALQGGKVSCLHCPMYFSFDTDQQLVAAIIAQHHLTEMDRPSEAIRQIEQLVKQEVSWWQLAAPEEQDRIYWMEYKANRPALESAFRLLVVKKKRSFFVTSGHFNHEHYQHTKA